MRNASILVGISMGLPLIVSFCAMTITAQDNGNIHDRRSSAASALFCIALLLTVCIPIAASSHDLVSLKAVLLLTGMFAIVGSAMGLNAAARKKTSD